MPTGHRLTKSDGDVEGETDTINVNHYGATTISPERRLRSLSLPKDHYCRIKTVPFDPNTAAIDTY